MCESVLFAISFCLCFAVCTIHRELLREPSLFATILQFLRSLLPSLHAHAVRDHRSTLLSRYFGLYSISFQVRLYLIEFVLARHALHPSGHQDLHRCHGELGMAAKGNDILSIRSQRLMVQ